MKKLFQLMFITVVLLSVPILAIGADTTTLVGSIQGFSCIAQHKVCPIGMEDAMAAQEEVLVLLVDPVKGDYYFLPNVSMKILARHINQEVKVVGYLDPARGNQAMEVKEIFVGPKEVWSNKMQAQLREETKK